MGIIKPLDFKIKQGDLDSDSRPLQQLETVHRTAIMPIARGKQPSGPNQFQDPFSIPSYYGFGANGFHYEAGAVGKTWQPKESIDDFTDLVTDPIRWFSLGTDLLEGGIDHVTDPPFGKRLHHPYGGPGLETYQRSGLMVSGLFTTGNIVISGRVTTKSPLGPTGTIIENSMIVGLEEFGAADTMVFAGFVDTVTYPFSIIVGHAIFGFFTYTAAIPLPPGTAEVTLAIEYDYPSGTYTGYYSLTPDDVDYTGPGWTTIAPPTIYPFVPFAVTPHARANYPVGYVPGAFHSLSDFRNEGSEVFLGEQRASWFLEPLDGGNPVSLSGTQQIAPDELFCVWERDNDGRVDLTLINVDDPVDPKLWRRWENVGRSLDWDREQFPFWSPGWLDADEGHIVMTRNTVGQETELASDAKCEVWIISLRWDNITIYTVDGLHTITSLTPDGSGRILRETGNWGSRRFIEQTRSYPASNYNHTNLPKTVPFAGTYKKIGTETVAPAISYGCSIRRCDDDEVYVSYGLQEVPTTLGDQAKYHAGIIRLEEHPTTGNAPRWLFRKDDAAYNTWDESSEAWVVTGLSQARALYWTQAGEDGPQDELEGLLCRRDFSGDAIDNLSTATYVEDIAWGEGVSDQYRGKGLNLFLQDSSPVGSELVIVATGWMGGSHATALWYNSATPSASIRRTYGGQNPTDLINDPFTTIMSGNIFPTWFLYRYDQTATSLARCRISRCAAVGVDSHITQANGFWLMYGMLDGINIASRRHELLRGPGINRGDFTLHLEGKWHPPFSSSFGSSAGESMTDLQNFEFYLGVISDKGLVGRAGLRIKGNFLGPGGYFAFGELNYINGSGVQTNTNEQLLPSSFTSGVDIKFRIVRTGNTWTFRVWDVGIANYVNVLSVPGALSSPCLPIIGVRTEDITGVGCSAGIEIDKIELAPTDDPVGSVWSPVVQFSTLPHRLGSVIGGATTIEAGTTVSTGEIVLADGWLFPGLMPAP